MARLKKRIKDEDNIQQQVSPSAGKYQSTKSKSKKIKIPIEVLSLQEQGYHLFVNGKLGNQDMRLLIDTGASKTVLDKNFITEHFSELILEASENNATGAGTNSIQSEFTEISGLKIGQLEIASYKIAVLDLKHVNETYSMINVTPIHGVIGSDLLVEFYAVINLKKRQLRMKKNPTHPHSSGKP